MGNARLALQLIQTPMRRVALGILAVALVFCGVKIRSSQGAAPQASSPATGPQTATPASHAVFQAARQLPTAYEGLATTAQILGSGQARPLTLVSDDFNRDGWPDLVAGYATGLGDGVLVLYLGDKEAFAPDKPEVLAGIAQGHSPTPFLHSARTFDVPEPPDFLAVGDFNRDGDPDLLI
ncbi:MAG TPA: VCBS repeat-containing protein, partial [Candidatus Methylomirabilis sp.]|nr:VCBS repeat-containing protein [Candidatus Methylomirabilis sp.]